MRRMELSERKKAILKSVVDAYIATGEPVGSKYLTANSDFNVSSATIRNEMSDLSRTAPHLGRPCSDRQGLPHLRRKPYGQILPRYGRGRGA